MWSSSLFLAFNFSFCCVQQCSTTGEVIEAREGGSNKGRTPNLPLGERGHCRAEVLLWTTHVEPASFHEHTVGFGFNPGSFNCLKFNGMRLSALGFEQQGESVSVRVVNCKRKRALLRNVWLFRITPKIFFPHLISEVRKWEGKLKNLKHAQPCGVQPCHSTW